MRTLHVKSLPFKDVIHNLAKELGAEYYEDCEVYFLKIPKEHGHGSIGGINFPTGIGVIYYSCQFNSDIRIKFDVNEVHPAKFLYCKEGYLRHCFLDSEEAIDLDKYQSAIVASKGNVGHQIQFKGGVKTDIASLEIDRKKFKSQVNCDLKTMNSPLKNVLSDTEATKSFYHAGDCSASLYNIMNSLSISRETGIVRRIYYQGKALEMLTEQIKQYTDDKKNTKRQSVIRQSELDEIRGAADELRNKLSENLTVSDLCAITGLNEHKIQAGFKMLYDSSVKEFKMTLRLNTAQDLLINTDLSIADIVHLIGLTNGGYFSAQFHKRFGFSPKDYRKTFSISKVI